jgi:hypothetical protein
MLRISLVALLFALSYLWVHTNNSDRYANTKPSDDILKIRQDVNQLLETIERRVVDLQKDKKELLQLIGHKSVVEFGLKWELYHSDNNARIFLQQLYQANNEIEVS